MPTWSMKLRSAKRKMGTNCLTFKVGVVVTDPRGSKIQVRVTSGVRW